MCMRLNRPNSKASCNAARPALLHLSSAHMALPDCSDHAQNRKVASAALYREVARCAGSWIRVRVPRPRARCML